MKNRVPCPIEVKSGMKQVIVPDGLKRFLDVYQDAPLAIVFNDSLSDEMIYEKRVVRFLPWTAAENIDFMQVVI